MANAIYEQEREDALGSGLGWVAGDFRAVLVKLDSAAGFGIAITDATNATPIVITCAAAPPTGAVVSISGVLGNLAANGHFRVTNLTGTTFSIQRYLENDNVAGSGVFDDADDPVFVRLDGAQFLSDIPGGARLATLPSSITGKAIVAAAADCDNWTWLAVGPDGGNDGDAVVVYEDTGVEGTSELLLIVTIATGLPVIPNGGDITFVVSSGVHKLFRF